MCMRVKTECKFCNKNNEGHCTLLDKPIDKIYKQWISSKKSKAKRKLKDNQKFFEKDKIDEILQQLTIIRDSETQSIEQIDAMNELSAIFHTWKTVDTEYL